LVAERPRQEFEQKGATLVASKATIEQIIRILLKYVDKKTALRLARDLHNHVQGNKNVVDTFRRIVEELVEMEE
jgi:hypothetical protein